MFLWFLVVCFVGFLFWVVFRLLFGCGVKGFLWTTAWFWQVVGVVHVGQFYCLGINARNGSV